MSGNLGGFRSRAPATASRGPQRNLLTFPGIGFLERQRQAMPGGNVDMIVAGLNPATSATPGPSIR